MTMTVVVVVLVVVAAAASVMIVFKTALWPLHHAFRATLVLTPSYRKAVMAAGEAAPPPLTLWSLCPTACSRRGGRSRWCRTGLRPHAAARVGGSPHRVTPAGAFMNAADDDCVVGEAVVPTARLQHPHRASSQRRHATPLLHLHPTCKPLPCPHTFPSQSPWRRHAAPLHHLNSRVGLHPPSHRPAAPPKPRRCRHCQCQIY